MENLIDKLFDKLFVYLENLDLDTLISKFFNKLFDLLENKISGNGSNSRNISKNSLEKVKKKKKKSKKAKSKPINVEEKLKEEDVSSAENASNLFEDQVQDQVQDHVSEVSESDSSDDKDENEDNESVKANTSSKEEKKVNSSQNVKNLYVNQVSSLSKDLYEAKKQIFEDTLVYMGNRVFDSDEKRFEAINVKASAKVEVYRRYLRTNEAPGFICQIHGFNYNHASLDCQSIKNLKKEKKWIFRPPKHFKIDDWKKNLEESSKKVSSPR